MSVKLMSAIFETEFRDLPDEEGNITKASTAKLVLLALADHANDEGEGAYPGLTKMERKTALSRQTVINTYGALKYNGIIFLAGISKRNTNNYTINTKAFPKAGDDSQPILLVNPVDSTSQATLPEVVNPLDPNHPLTINESSSKTLKTDELLGKYKPAKKGDLMDLELMKLQKTQVNDEAFKAFERDLQCPGSWSWYPAKSSDEPAWKSLREFVVTLYQSDPKAFEKYYTWARDPFSRGAKLPIHIRQDPTCFEYAWQAYQAANPSAGNSAPINEEGKGFYV